MSLKSKRSYLTFALLLVFFMTLEAPVAASYANPQRRNAQERRGNSPDWTPRRARRGRPDWVSARQQRGIRRGRNQWPGVRRGRVMNRRRAAWRNRRNVTWSNRNPNPGTPRRRRVRRGWNQ